LEPFGNYSSTNGSGLSCPSTTNCLAPNIFYDLPQEIYLQGVPNPNTRVISNSFYDTGSFYMEGWQDIFNNKEINSLDFFDLNPNNANRVYRHITCEILNDINNLPPLPSGESYSIIWTFFSMSHVFGGENPVMQFSYDIYINVLDM